MVGMEGKGSKGKEMDGWLGIGKIGMVGLGDLFLGWG